MSGKINYGQICARSPVLKRKSKEMEPILGSWNVAMGSRVEFIPTSLKKTGSRIRRFPRNCSGDRTQNSRLVVSPRTTWFFGSFRQTCLRGWARMRI